MRQLFIFLILLPFLSAGQQITTRFEQSNGTQTPTYAEAIGWWQRLAAAAPIVKMQAMGSTDAGLPLNLVLVSAAQDFDIATIKKKAKAIILINNGIHPGEPDGIDASMLLVRDIVAKKITLSANVVLAIIPIYNIGGALNRGANYRVDQNGPEEFGFRGNAQNLDLNRDFIKSDSKNAHSFAQIFHLLDPDVFIDTHVSNGADFQHVMTLLTSQKDKLGGVMGQFLQTQFEPALYRTMHEKGFDMVPYVNHSGETPDKGWVQFWDGPRYSSGYATLWNTFAFVPETHMLKPYTQRVQATYALLQSFVSFTSNNAATIIALRQQTKKRQATQDSFAIAWKHDPSKHISIPFKGYTAGYKTSAVSGLPRLYYDRTKPLNIKVPFYNTYVDSITVQKPKAYLVPQGWWKVVQLLQLNGVPLQQLKNDTAVMVEAYHIEKYTASPRPYEGHHINRNVVVSKTTKRMIFRKGDYLIPLNSAANRFAIETLEPQAEDSYFAWNFFDPILQQKEGFSDYAFEETAATFLKTHTGVQKLLDEKRKSDSSFAKNAAAQLDFIYRNSPYYEGAHLQYPVYRLVR